MSSSEQHSASASSTRWAVGTIFFAGVLLLVLGIWQAFVGLVALVNDEFFVVGAKWIFQFDLTTWGWIHCVLGAAIFVVGIFVLQGGPVVGDRLSRGGLGQRDAELHVAAVDPIWSIVMIAVDLLIIWALATHRQSIHLVDR